MKMFLTLDGFLIKQENRLFQTDEKITLTPGSLDQSWLHVFL